MDGLVAAVRPFCLIVRRCSLNLPFLRVPGINIHDSSSLHDVGDFEYGTHLFIIVLQELHFFLPEF